MCLSVLGMDHGACMLLLIKRVSVTTADMSAHRGITLAPGSGVVMAELIATDLTRDDVKLSADISGLSPHRFRAAKL